MDIFAFILAIAALFWAYRNRIALDRLQQKQLELQKESGRLRSRLDELMAREAAGRAAPHPKAAEPPKQAQPVGIPPIPKPVVTTLPPPAKEPPPPPEQPPLMRPPLSPSPRVAPAPPPPVSPSPGFDWETLVGVKLFSWIAGIALVFAAIFFLKYSVDHGWLGPPIRMAIGLVTGVALLVVCEWKHARRYVVTANALDAAGIAILFSTFFAAHALWNLLDLVPTFVLMAMVTAVAVLLSIRHDSVFVALLGLVGGFATPAMLSTGEDRPIGLFSYLLLLNAGLAWVAYKKRWPKLTVLSAVFTTIYQWAWVLKFLQSGSLPLALGIFLVFPVLSFVALALGEKGENDESSLFHQTSAIAVAVPLLFALFMAAVPAYGDRYWLLFGFLFLVDVGLLAIAAKRGPEMLHLAGAIATVLTFVIWLQMSYKSAAWPAILAITSVFVLLYLAAGYFRGLFSGIGLKGVFAAPLLLVAFPLLVRLEPSTASPGLLFSVLFALMTAIAVYAIAREDGPVHFLASFFALSAEAVWSANYLDPSRLLAALSIYVVFGLFYLGVPIVAGRWDKSSVFTQGLYFALVAHGFLFFIVLHKPLSVPPWPFLGALAVLDLAIGAAALYTRSGGIHLGALLLSQTILVFWQTTAQIAPWPQVAILCALAVSGIGFIWLLLAERLGISEQEQGGTFALAGAVGAFAGLAVIITAVTLPGVPQVTLVAGASALLVGLILATEWITYWHLLAPISVAASSIVLLVWSAERFKPESWSEEFLFAAVIYALFLIYPLLLSYRAMSLLEPYLAAVMASVPFFFFARHSLMAGGFAGRIGLLPVAQALLMSGLLWRLFRLEPPGERTQGRLAMVAGAVLAFVTVAIPLQLEKQWITIGWALLAAALAWLWRRIPHPGLVVWTAGLLAAVFVRLVFNPAVLSYHPRGAVPIWNWYLYTYLVSAAAFFAAGWFLRDANTDFLEGLPPIRTIAATGGTVLLFLVLNIEIADYYSKGPDLTFNFSADLAQDLTYTIGWGLFSFALLIAAILLRSKPGRLSAILLLSITVAKCFLHDLWRLGGLYRVGSFVGLAICLTLVALLLQRFVLRPQHETQ